MIQKKSVHILWVTPSTDLFFRSKGEVQCRAGSVIPKLVEKGYRVTVLLPYDATLLPKTKLAATRVSAFDVKLEKKHSVEISKLSRAQVSPAIFMARLPNVDNPLRMALFSKAALSLAQQLKRNIDIVHLFGWETSLFPLYLELDHAENKFLSNTRTFLTVNEIHDQGNFAPEIMNAVGLPLTLFHPEGLEFYGQFSFLKTGVMFSDGVGLVEPTRRNGRLNGASKFSGVLDAQLFKLRRWNSDRSVKSYLDAYQELLVMLKAKPRLPRLVKRLHKNSHAAEKYMEIWGPQPPPRYFQNYLTLLTQNPVKAYAYWEWNDSSFVEFGLMRHDLSNGDKTLLGRHLSEVGEFWIDVEPDREYFVELVGWTRTGEMRILLRSNRIRTARDKQSPNRRATFVDMRTRRRFRGRGVQSWDRILKLLKGGGTSAAEWGPEGVGVPVAVAESSQFRKDLL